MVCLRPHIGLEELSARIRARPERARVRDMLHTALDAFLSLNEARAQDVLAMDDRVDELLEQVYRHKAEVVEQDGTLSKPALRELSTAKYLERIADHATNIAEDVIYMATGDIVKHQH